VLVKRYLDELIPEDRLLRQSAENCARHDLSERDARDLVLRLRDGRRLGKLSPPPEPPTRQLRKPIPGHPEDLSESENSLKASTEKRIRHREPGSTRELAAMTGWSQTKVATLLAGPEPAPTPNDEIRAERLPSPTSKPHQKRSPNQALEIRMLNLARDLEKLGKVPTECWKAAAALSATLRGLLHPDEQG
jgi:hypothetical protein